MDRDRTPIHLIPRRSVVLCCALAIIPPQTARAEQDPPGSVEGIVVDRLTHLAVISAIVTVGASGSPVLTDAAGRFKVEAVAAGVHDLAVRAAGYADLVQPNVRVSPGQATTVTFELEPHSVPASNEAAPSTNAASPQPRKNVIPFGFGFGLSVERRIASDSNATDVWGVTLLPRFIGHGFGRTFDIPWTNIGVVSTRGPASTELGVVRMKPTMFGVMWQEPLAPNLSAEIQFVAGYSFNSADQAENATHKAHLAVPQPVVAIDNSFAWETRLAIWREFAPRIGFMAAARYLHTRPRLTFADGTDRDWKADRVTLEAGLAVTLIKPPRRLGR